MKFPPLLEAGSVFGLVCGTAYMLGAVPPNEASPAAAATIAGVVTVVAWVLVSRLGTPKSDGRWRWVAVTLTALAVAIALFYQSRKDKLVFGFPPENPRAEYVGGTSLTSAAQKRRDETNASLAQLVDDLGGLDSIDLVFPPEARRAGQQTLAVCFALVLASFALAGLAVVRTSGGLIPISGSSPVSPPATPATVAAAPRIVASPTNSTTATILFLGANPSDTTRLALDREWRAIDERLRLGSHGHRFELKQEWAVRPKDLLDSLLRYQPNIVHFSGHGEEVGEIVLADDADGSSHVTTAAVAALFEEFSSELRCVVLNACYSEVQADLIARHIDCVIGMSQAVEDEVAIAFAETLYGALAYGRSIQAAFSLACKQLDVYGLAQSDVPQLICREGVDAKRVFVLDKAT